jgi:arabinofuranosyltransferase
MVRSDMTRSSSAVRVKKDGGKARETIARRHDGEALVARYAPAVLAALAAGAVALALANRFVQDDAFISFVYARNLARGAGPTWFGTRIEGYTNFLWMLWIALGMTLGVDPIVWADVGSIAAFAAAVVGVERLGRALLGSRMAALIAVLLFITNYTVVSYATGGMETMLQTSLLCWMAVLAIERPAPTRDLWLGVLASLAVLTRLDSALPAGIILLVRLHDAWARSQLRSTLARIGPVFALPIAAWLAWKVHYYGRLLPNTYYVKVDFQFNPNGLVYVGRFLHWYAIWPFLVAAAAVLAIRRRVPPRALLLPAAVVVTWVAYVIAAGGDFMEFRFLVPIAPFLVVLLAYAIVDVLADALHRPVLVTAACTAILIAASIMHARSFTGITADQALDSIHMLSTFYGLYGDGRFSAIGDRLRTELGGKDVRIALHPAGAIPFYSDVDTVDMLGLNDAEVAEHGILTAAVNRRPGHRRWATLRYLEARQVNLVLGAPIVVPPGLISSRAGVDALHRWMQIAMPVSSEQVDQAVFVGIPIDRQRSLIAWYLTKSPALDDTIRREHWEFADVDFEHGTTRGGRAQ